jgi:hypothetical protein
MSQSMTTDDWTRRFLDQFERHLGHTPAQAPDVAMARAVLATYLESGVESEEALELLGQAALEAGSADVEWTDELNQRRLALIDKDIQGTLTPAEKVELAGLTRIMRQRVDTEANLPLQGARDLHRKLLELESLGERR